MLPLQAKKIVHVLLVGSMTFVTAAASGCVSGSLASTTGPRPPGHRWSDVPKQKVHIGEQVEFDFILVDWMKRLVNPVGLADYCVALIGKTRLETEPDRFGHCSFSFTFDEIGLGQTVQVVAGAYLQRGARDFMKVRGQWMESESPFEQRDRKVAEDQLTLTVYATEIILRLPRPADELEPQTGVLRIRRADGESSSVYIDRPNRPGFVMRGPDSGGYYHVSYRPSGREVASTGSTSVEFLVYDTSGRSHKVVKSFETP